MLQEANRILRLVAAAGGKVMGRKRFQKAVYPLQFLGYPLPETPSYHHYGSYSPELQDELDFLAKIGLQVVLYPGEDGYWVAECPSLPGCISGLGATCGRGPKMVRLR